MQHTALEGETLVIQAEQLAELILFLSCLECCGLQLSIYEC